ncbi:MAG: virulence factor, partial [Anaerolineales bacterium]
KIRWGKERLTAALSDRFQAAVDQAAMRSQTTTEGDYLEEWNASDWNESNQEAEPLLITLVDKIESDYSDEVLKTLIANNGYKQRL